MVEGLRLTAQWISRNQGWSEINDPSYQSNMPAYDGILSDEEIIAVLSYIKSTWPEEIKIIHDEME